MITIIKRDGRKVPFNELKIVRALQLAGNDTFEKEVSNEKLYKIVADVKDRIDGTEVDVSEIHRLVEEYLMQEGCFNTARTYIEYRKARDIERYRKLDITKKYREKLDGKCNECQNANLDEMSFGGRKGEGDSVMNRELALNYYMDSKFAKNHNDNIVYIHDLDSYIVGNHNCLSIPFDDLLKNGFTTKQCDVRPANSINTAFQLLAVIFELQSLMQFGGVSATHIDTTMIPYVRKSFFKHFVDGLKFAERCSEKKIAKIISPLEKDVASRSIVSEDYSKRKKAYDYAMKMTVKETEQAVEGMFHNLNTMQSRSGNQLPFTSINYGLDTSCEGRMISKAIHKSSIKGTGKHGRTSIFPCQIIQMKNEINGNKDSPNRDIFDNAIESTTRRLYPNYANTSWSVQMESVRKDRELKRNVIADLLKNDFMLYNSILNWVMDNPEDARKINLKFNCEDSMIDVSDDVEPSEEFSTMGCRTNNGYDSNFTEEYFLRLLNEISDKGKLPDNFLYSAVQRDGRGNVAPSTIILPTVAMIAKSNGGTEKEIVERFMSLLEKYICECRDGLVERFEWICSQPSESATFMYENNTMKGYEKDKGIRSALIHGTLAIGQLGLAECLQILIGCDHTVGKGMNLAIRIEKLFKEKCDEFKKKEYECGSLKYHLNFGNYFTPSENLCHTAMKKFRAKYGVIENVSNHEYFTNSIHVPVWKKISPFKKIDIESKLTGFSSSGCITYVELDDNAVNNREAVRQIIEYAMNKDIPYFALNLKIDFCTKCGYQGMIDGEECPVCGSQEYEEVDGKKTLTNNIERLRRVTGYITGSYKKTFNVGKQHEVEERYEHVKKLDGWVSR